MTLGSCFPSLGPGFLLHSREGWISDSLRPLPALTGSETVLTDVS